jgi:hypothetical protein
VFFETSAIAGRSDQGACWISARSTRRARVPARDVKLVDRSAKYAHCDPLFDDPADNDFLTTVVPFLQRID